MKKIKVFIVKDSGKILTIVDSKKKAFQYADKYLKSKHYSHFKSWCDLRNLEVTEDSWKLYGHMCGLNNALEFMSGKVEIGLLLSSYRCVTGCIPLGMPWEIPAEMAEFLKKMPEESLMELDSALEKIAKKLEGEVSEE